MYNLTSSQTAQLITDLTSDFWQSRNHVITEDNPTIYIPYRISVSTNGDNGDNDVNLYIHYVVEANRWWYTISEIPPFEVDHSTLKFPDDECSIDHNLRGTSYRHYLFNDCLKDAIEDKIVSIKSTMKGNTSTYLWSTFPVRTFRGNE